MNVELITIDPEVAKTKLAAYRKAIAARHHRHAAQQTNAEWQRIADGYRMAAKGLQLIELSKAMAQGGWDEQGRPNFAVWRADEKMVRCDRNGRELKFYSATRPSYHQRGTKFIFNTASWAPLPSTAKNVYGVTAIVPIVPPDVLPRSDLDLSKRVILWEADWSEAPVDPLLLLPIGGDLYAVEAAWDLTPLERAVIANRA